MADSDFLSSMPPEIIEKILVKLPIKEAVRTSVLSRKWKSSWASIPDLVFSANTIESQLIESVDKVLQMHQGPILKFEVALRTDQHVPEEAINRWLLILSKNGLKDLRLIFKFDGDCRVPSSLFSCHKLERLEIERCTLNAPQCFQGLKLLRDLTLAVCYLKGITIEKFVSVCPLLESLTLLGIVNQDCIAIRAPNLKQLDFLGPFNDFLLETPKLISATISTYGLPFAFSDFSLPNDGCNSKLLRAMGALSNIEKVKIDSDFCQYLASGLIPEKLLVTFHQLKWISIVLDDRTKVIDTALCIFQKAPNLKTLCLKLPSQIIWDQQRITSISFPKGLEVVVICAFNDVVSLLEFAKFILSTAPQLEKLVIDQWGFDNLDDRMGFLIELASFPRLSSKAVILFDVSCRY
ncbi:hypothetical protein LUZ63_000946 [Rhynchospora breviuscula]|uniref:F-box domain-containing protein n=1 Tax=Rhynchospora breviuscula TaxID=2022672 RepID=A0A9Q0CWV6_9POAL|nr:hypothetical protein LUZ63_000946 [Rhynchospora breviuscula]